MADNSLGSSSDSRKKRERGGPRLSEDVKNENKKKKQERDAALAALCREYGVSDAVELKSKLFESKTDDHKNQDKAAMEYSTSTDKLMESEKNDPQNQEKAAIEWHTPADKLIETENNDPKNQEKAAMECHTPAFTIDPWSAFTQTEMHTPSQNVSITDDALADICSKYGVSDVIELRDTLIESKKDDSINQEKATSTDVVVGENLTQSKAADLDRELYFNVNASLFGSLDSDWAELTGTFQQTQTHSEMQPDTFFGAPSDMALANPAHDTTGCSKTDPCSAAKEAEDFVNKLRNSSMKVEVSEFKHLPKNWDSISLPAYLAHIAQAMNQKDITANCRYAAPLVQSQVTMFYAAIEEMHSVKIEDVDEKSLVRWGLVFRDCLELGMKVEFAMQRLEKVAHCYFSQLKVPSREQGELQLLQSRISELQSTLDELVRWYKEKSEVVNAKMCSYCSCGVGFDGDLSKGLF